MTKAQKQAEAVLAVAISYNVTMRKAERNEEGFNTWRQILKEDLRALRKLGIPIELGGFTEKDLA